MSMYPVGRDEMPLRTAGCAASETVGAVLRNHDSCAGMPPAYPHFIRRQPELL